MRGQATQNQRNTLQQHDIEQMWLWSGASTNQAGDTCTKGRSSWTCASDPILDDRHSATVAVTRRTWLLLTGLTDCMGTRPSVAVCPIPRCFKGFGFIFFLAPLLLCEPRVIYIYIYSYGLRGMVCSDPRWLCWPLFSVLSFLVTCGCCLRWGDFGEGFYLAPIPSTVNCEDRHDCFNLPFIPRRFTVLIWQYKYCSSFTSGTATLPHRHPDLSPTTCSAHWSVACSSTGAEMTTLQYILSGCGQNRVYIETK